jgi:hypothetical protein
MKFRQQAGPLQRDRQAIAIDCTVVIIVDGDVVADATVRAGDMLIHTRAPKSPPLWVEPGHR